MTLLSLNAPLLQMSSLLNREDKQLVLSSLKLLSITSFENSPEWISHECIKEYIHTETSYSLERLFSRINDESVTQFNQHTSSKISSALLKYLSHGVGSQRTLSDEFKSRVELLKLFEGQLSSEQRCLVSLKENNRIYTGRTFPSPFIDRTIVLHSETEIAFTKGIQGNFISEFSLVSNAVANAQKYNDTDRQNLMRWIVRKSIYIDDENIRTLLSKTQFLKTEDGYLHEPKSLFDPLDKTLSCLFKNQNMIPIVDAKDRKYIDGLRKLGLKSKNDLSTTDIVKACNIVNDMAIGKISTDKKKCKALLDIMNARYDLVEPKVLEKKRCIYVENPCQHHHMRNTKLLKSHVQFCCPPEVKSIEYAPLVSSVHNLIECDQLPNLSRVFHWTEPPGIESVARQLLTVVQIYENKLKSEILPIITSIYEWFTDQSNLHEVKDTLQNVFSSHNNQFVWTGNGFQAPLQVFTESKENDIDMQPFVIHLPEELRHLSTFFLQLGCQKCQTFEMYIRTLHQIRMSNEKVTTRLACSMNVALRIIIEILNKIKQDHFNELILSKAELYFPVVCQDKGILFKPVKECTFCDAEWLRDIEVEKESGIFYIHPDVPKTTAEKLGATPLTRVMLGDTEAFEEWGQEEPLTRRLKNILKDGYTDGFSIAKELLQNADDAKAKKFWLLYDERENYDARSHLLSDDMADFQGPAIWVYNEAKFSPEDLKNITQLYGETKKDDASKIGRFGLGFCAVYNITDVPSFVTGSNFVIFDPHTKYLGRSLLGRSPGLKISLTHNLVRRFRNQFKPFEGIFGCNLMTDAPYFDGTLFRLPLRTKTSDISKKLYLPSKVNKLFKKIMDLSANMLIFNQNIQEIKIFHMSKTEKDPTKLQICFEVSKNETHLKRNVEFQANIVNEVTKRKAEKSLKDNPLQVLSKIEISGKRHNDSFLSKKKNKNVRTFVGKWLVSWSTCVGGKSICVSDDDENGALPLGGVAVPVTYDKKSRLTFVPLKSLDNHFFTTGHLFFFLPLPIEHDFPFHINSQFSVTSDRRHLETNNEDDMNLHRKYWNELMLKDSVMNALLYLLGNVSHLGHLVDYEFTQLWPRNESALPLRCLSSSFYAKVVGCKEYKLFEQDGKWFDISECVFLEKEFLASSVGRIAFEFLSLLTGNVVHIPKDFYLLLFETNKKIIQSKTVTKTAFYLEKFLPRLEEFGTDNLKEKRNKLLLNAIKFRESSIDSWLKNNRCIPSCPYGMLKRPAEMIDPSCRLANLFERSDEVFPDEKFEENIVLSFLRDLGLKHEMLTDDILLSRAHSITLCKCDICALERSRYLLLYLSENACNHKDVLVKLKDIEFLPIKVKPKNWHFSWYASDRQKHKHFVRCPKHFQPKMHYIQFSCAQKMFHSDCTNLVGSLKYIFAEDVFLGKQEMHRYNTEDMKMVLQMIGMEGIPKEDVDYEIVTKQLLTISSFGNEKKKTHYKDNISVIDDIYQYLDSSCERERDIKEKIRNILCASDVVWIDDVFVSPSNVARRVPQDCKPYLFKLDDSPLKCYKQLCECLDIRKVFRPQHVAHSLQSIKTKKNKSCLTEIEVQKVINILHLLKFSLLHEHINDVCVIFDDKLKAVYGPDNNRFMRDMTQMCFNDFFCSDNSSSMIYCHELIPKALAEVFGVMSKKVMLLEEDSEDVEDFGQEEPLAIRLQRIVENYPCDSGIFKELIQNADDANATEIHFLKDCVHHPVKDIFDRSFEPLQGPALCVFNNSSFTKDDLEGIKRLGVGSKSRDPSKTGRYGVGFNAVYNLTDVPSLYSRGSDLEKGETLFFFDPVMRYIPKVTKSVPGKRYTNVQRIRKNSSDVMCGYHESYFMERRNKTGSVFRFPLRTDEMAKESTIKKSGTSMKEITEMLNAFCHEMKDILLFLKNIKTIRVSSFDKSYVEEFVIHVHMTQNEERKRKEFFANQFAVFKGSGLNSVALWERMLQTKQTYITYELEIQEIYRSKEFELKKTEVGKRRMPFHFQPKRISEKDKIVNKTKYIVAQTIGFRDIHDIPQVVQHDCQKGDIDLLPYGGVALFAGEQLDSYENIVSHNKSKAFCFLPLPVRTGLPLHIHGYFSLDHEIRRGLWKAEDENKCSRTLWNLTLIEQVITHAYIILLKYMKEQMFKNVSNSSPLKRVMDILKNFQNLFPDREKIEDFYWQHLLKCVYKSLVSEEIPFLPLVHTTKYNTKQVTSGNVTQRMAMLSWTALRYKGYSFEAFDSPECEEENRNFESDLNNMLRSLGMRIITVSKQIKNSMEFSEVEISSLQPVHVIRFLCSFNTSSLDKCNVITNRDVHETQYRSKETLLKITEYCLQDEECFMENIKSLPLMMTQDLTVHTLQDVNALFVEETGITFNLFPSKRSMFLHKSVSKMIQTKIKDFLSKTDEKCRNFKIEDLAELVSVSEKCLLQKDGGAVLAWNKDRPSSSWIGKFWTLFFHLMPLTGCQTDDVVKNNLSVVQDLFIIPAVKILTNQTFLVKPLHRNNLIDLQSFSKNEQLHKALSGLHLLEIDDSVISDTPLRCLLNQIPTFDRAKDVVQCLHLNLNTVFRAAISLDDATEIIKYFDGYLGSDTPDNIFTDMLSEIPIFVSNFNERLALKGYSKIYVAPSDLPIYGLKDIARNASSLLLRDIGTDVIFRKLNIPKMKLSDVYNQFIIPHIQYIGDESLYKHLEFLANLFETSPDDVNLLLNVLRNTPMIYIEELRKRVMISTLFDPNQKIFKVFCQREELLPAKFKTLSKFFRSLGLKTRMSEPLFVQFAKHIEAKVAKEGITKELDDMSALLLKHFFSMDGTFFSSNSFDKLAKIKFITPISADISLSNIHEFHNVHQFICFEGSVLPPSVYTCWTVSNILSNIADPKVQCPKNGNELVQKLKICQKPNVKSLVMHCLNIGARVSENPKKLRKSAVGILQSVMGKVYKELCDYIESGELEKVNAEQLIGAQLVFVQKIRQMVLPESIVITCKDDEEICPFLNRCPDEYIQYKDLFLLLGARREICCDTFASVLYLLNKSCQGSDVLLPQEKSDAIKATKLFFSYLAQESKEVEIKDRHSIMLSENYTLENSRNLVVKNNSYYQKQLNKVNYKKCLFLIDFESLQDPRLKLENCVDSLQYLPTQNRPYLLTDIVRERVVLRNIVDKDSRRALQLEDFIHGRSFIDGFVRLVRHTRRIEGRNWTSGEEIRFLNHLGNIQFRHASGIETLLAIKHIEDGELQAEQLIENTNEVKSVHLENNENKVVIYFDSSDESWFESVQTELTVHLNGLAEKCLKDQNLMLLRQIIGMTEYPEKISWYLSKQKIEEYDSSVNIPETFSYPKPGTFVPRELYVYLDNDYDQIYDYEYKFVALEIEDPDLSESIEGDIDKEDNNDRNLDPTYIFVHVVKKLEHEADVPLMQEYEINDGTENILRVKAYQLYKFVRKSKIHGDKDTQAKGMKLVIYSRDTRRDEGKRTQSMSLKTAYKEIRMSLTEAWKQPEREKSKIVKRLLLKWHPDKNPGNVPFCTKVFQYIQQCIQRLEKGMTLIDSDDEKDGENDYGSGTGRKSSRFRTQDFWSSRFGRYWKRYERRRTFYEEENRRSRDEPGTEQSTGGAPFTMPETKPFHYYAEARRWQKQAKSDLHNSTLSLQQRLSYNWVCYMAHQVFLYFHFKLTFGRLCLCSLMESIKSPLCQSVRPHFLVLSPKLFNLHRWIYLIVEKCSVQEP